MLIAKVLIVLGVCVMLNGIVMTWHYARASIAAEQMGKARLMQTTFGRGIEWALTTVAGLLLIIAGLAVFTIIAIN